MTGLFMVRIMLPSRPARGAWVEIKDLYAIRKVAEVAPRKGRVG